MTIRMDMDIDECGLGDTKDVEDFLEAADELEKQLDVEPGVVVRQLTALVRRQAHIARLRQHFGASLSK